MSTRPRITFDAGTLTLERISREDLARVFAPIPWVWDPRAGVWRCDAMHYASAVELARQAGLELKDEVPDWRAVVWGKLRLHALRPEQQEALAAWRLSRRGLIVMPTGTGKTEVALAAMAEASVATLVVAPVRDLMYQWHRRIAAGLEYDAGVIGDSLFRVRPVSVTTYDSACIHMERLGNQFGLIVFDECHHLPGEVRRDAARMSAAPMRLGLTATPERSDGRHVDLAELIGPVLYEMPLAEARGQTLADYDVVRIPVHLSPEERVRYDELSRVVRSYLIQRRKDNPSYGWQDLCSETGKTPEARFAIRAYYAKKSIEDRAEEKLRVLEDLFRLHAGQACLVFAGSNAMARDVSRRFLIPCLLNHCGKKERLEVLQGLADGTYPALVANQVLDEGVDLPEVKVAVVIGGTASSRQAKQRLGRVLRKRGGARAVLYEIVCADTNEEKRSRLRRGSDAYQGARRGKRGGQG
jgi:superfamily II DNA or RNA helicase